MKSEWTHIAEIYVLPLLGNVVNAIVVAIVTSKSKGSGTGQHLACPRGFVFICLWVCFLTEGCYCESKGRQTNRAAQKLARKETVYFPV